MQKVIHMVGGEDEASYAKNSSHQRMVLREVRPILEKCMEELILGDIEDLPSCLKVADLGCSSGPNTFLTLQQIIESIDKACKIKNIQEPPSNIHYFLNDLVSNDFNLVFRGLPQFREKLEKENGRSCLIAAAPGTFYGKLFPDASMHFLHSSYSLHWLSQVPSGLVTESGIPMNKGSNIYRGKTSPPVVHQLYLDQFRRDFSLFLSTRSREMVRHGHLLLTLLCENINGDQELLDGSNVRLGVMGMALSELVTEGFIEENKLDSFNLPIYKPSVEEIRQIIESEGSFRVLRFHAFKTRLDAVYDESSSSTVADHDDHHHLGNIDVRRHDDDDDVFDRARHMAANLRAIFQSVLVTHFGEAILDDLFHKIANKLVNILRMGEGFLNTLVISLCKE